MKQYLMEYTGPEFFNAFNLGDDIQTLAAQRLLPEHDGYLSREHLDTATENGLIVLNGFFMSTDNWPPAPGLTPVFFSFHIRPSKEKVICSPEGIAYLKRHEPIGCRDTGTAALLRRYGVQTYYSKCLTLTLERRREEPRDGKVFLVGVGNAGRSIIPRALRKKAVVVNQHWVRLPGVPCSLKFDLARNLLETYKRTASLVITSKIHCAMPCIAMGIPVVFLWDQRKKGNPRVQLIEDLIGINHVPGTFLDQVLLNRLRSGRIDWSPKAVDIEAEKKAIVEKFREALDAARARHLARFPEGVS